MMTYRKLGDYVAAEPFRPFKIHTASGRSFEVRHPEVVQVGKTKPTLSVPLADIPDAEGTRYKISLMLIESIEPLESPVRSRGEPQQ